MDYYLSNVFYLPKKIPEDIIWSEKKAEQLIQITINNQEEKEKNFRELTSLSSTKKKFAKLSKIIYGSDRAEDIASIHKLFLQYWLQEENDDFKDVKSSVDSILWRI